MGAAMEFHPTAKPVTLERAAELFAQLAARNDIPFRLMEDGCYARAHLIVEHLLSAGVVVGKVWSFAQSLADPLWVNPRHRPEVVVYGRYHVAPTIQVQVRAELVRTLVLGPALFDQPVDIEKWRDIQHDAPRLVQTTLGQPPPPLRDGSGYWPGPDPPEGPDRHARKTLEEHLARLREQEGEES